ncbi:N-formylglutamate amidohydrolase [Shimia sp. CNT1-13L.2]|uniref:N-formylglutamate amidohydrolase n=1 Tax=Shimia sp. CNT1-13L.2 TaxID=2959663 RepID=UPI0020CC77E5|nr:N-formylglutamate amidohydrolase [Shimia sp. CNT1-13L.2]MCP9480762.1 N-formylglutamate amidohydrolase [Shimia sp. CNT1-13L.2]
MTYQPFHIYGAERKSRWLITVDHASNHVPVEINGGDLGLAAEDMQRHIAFDVGALGTSLRLGELLDAPVIASNFSRLVIDPNRGEDDPTLVMHLYDGTIIPANRNIDEAEIERRKQAYYLPYHNALADLAAAREDVIIIAMHSFSPKLNGRAPRPWEIGILHAPQEDRFGIPFIKRLEQEGDLTVGDNEPYAGHLPGDSVDKHAFAHGRLNALIELRHDEIDTETKQSAWAERLAPILTDVLDTTGL